MAEDTYEPLSEATFRPDAYDNPDIMAQLLKSSEAFFDPINCMFCGEPIWDHQVVFAQRPPHEVIGIIRDKEGDHESTCWQREGVADG